MKKNVRLISFCFFFVLLAVFDGQAQIRFKANISPQVIGKGETAQLDLIVENGSNIASITPPALTDFVVVAGPNQTRGYQDNNGVTTSSFTLSYVLQPRRTGQFTLDAATASVDGKNFSSNKTTLRVVNQPTGNSPAQSFTDPFAGMDDLFGAPRRQTDYADIILRKGEDIAEKVRKNLFIRIETSKRSCYVGEPVVVSYKLYTRLRCESKLVKNPSFNGFSVVDMQLPDISNASAEMYNGREYRVYTIRKAQLYALQPGVLELESAEVENTIHFIEEEYLRTLGNSSKDPYLRFAESDIPAEGRKLHQANVQSNTASISVRALPEAGKPAGFSGAVGNLSISASLDNARFSTDDAGHLVLSITGSGNMPLVTAPDIAWPKGVEVFEPKMTEDLTRQEVPVSGTKYYEYSFTIDSAGNYTLPPLELAYFDPSSGTYKKAQTKPIPFTVSKGEGRPKDTIRVGQAGGERFFNKIFSNRWWIVGPLIGLILAGLGFWIVRENKRIRKGKAAEKAADAAAALAAIQLAAQLKADHANPLERAHALLEQPDRRVFLAALLEDLRQFVSLRYHLPVHEFNRKSLGEQLDKKGVSNDTVLGLQQLLEDIEWQLYTPTGGDTPVQVIYDRALGIAETLRLG